jgi:hypothetical protein
MGGRFERLVGVGRLEKKVGVGRSVVLRKKVEERGQTSWSRQVCYVRSVYIPRD